MNGRGATIILIRHAVAGERAAWPGPDHMRPLNEDGRQQSRHIAEVLIRLAPERLLTSSYVRCIETLEPFAARTSVDIDVHRALAEGSAAADVESLLKSLTGVTALCTHGDICRLVTTWAHQEGLPLAADAETSKGAIWVLDLEERTAVMHPAPSRADEP